MKKARAGNYPNEVMLIRFAPPKKKGGKAHGESREKGSGGIGIAPGSGREKASSACDSGAGWGGRTGLG